MDGVSIDVAPVLIRLYEDPERGYQYGPDQAATRCPLNAGRMASARQGDCKVDKASEGWSKAIGSPLRW